MYRRCIFCSADLGVNESIEEFPVGRRLAFDAWKGRLWAVCQVCERWNLAPIEERWEAVESAERLFAGTNLRVASENIGLAALPDGTRLVRVGKALPGELAAWRYGDQLRRRRKDYWLRAAVMVGFGALTGFAALPGHVGRHRVVALVSSPGDSPSRALRVKLKELNRTEFRVDGASGELRAHLRLKRGPLRRRHTVALVGLDARMLLDRALLQVNQAGAGESRLMQALNLLDAAGSAEACVRGLGLTDSSDRAYGGGAVLRLRERWHGGWRAEEGSAAEASRPPIEPARALALEMALQDDAERRALEGELDELRERWSEADLIAGIADRLPDEPEA